MPRPKRTKVAVSRPALRVAKPVKATEAPMDPIEDIYGVSDPVEEPTASASPMSGQNASSETGAGRITRSTHTTRGRALERTRRKRDLAIGRLEAENLTSTTESDVPLPSTEQQSSSPAIEVGRRAPTDNSVLTLENLRRRVRQPSILGRGRAGRSSSIEPILADRAGGAHAPKRANSLLPATGLRKRVREPSILGRAASRVRSSSLGMEVADTPSEGSPKVERLQSRKRQSSILGTGRARSQGRNSDFEDIEDDFNPDDESTPLNLSKTRLLAEQSSQSASSASNPRKRKLGLTPDPPSSLPRTINDHDMIVGATPSTEPRAERSPRHTTRLLTQVPLSDTMAPPQSSSPPPRQASANSARFRRQLSQEPLSTATHHQQPRRRAPLDDSPPSSPPSLTHSPNLRPTTKIAPKRHIKPPPDPTSFTTAQLQSLLPRRRHREARDPLAFESDGEAEIDTTGLGSDDDELTHLSIATGRKTRRTREPPSSTRQVTKFKATKMGKGKADESRTRRVYGARTTDSDKENAGEEDTGETDPDHSLAPLQYAEDGSPENSQELEARVGKELKKAKRKFEDVDKWELEFEDVTASSSSPTDAR